MTHPVLDSWMHAKIITPRPVEYLGLSCLQSYSGLIQEDSLLTVGVGWENSRLDVTARLTPEFMKTLGEFGAAFGLFRAAVNGTVLQGNKQK